jgi:hypothetical protein
LQRRPGPSGEPLPLGRCRLAVGVGQGLQKAGIDVPRGFPSSELSTQQSFDSVDALWGASLENATPELEIRSPVIPNRHQTDILSEQAGEQSHPSLAVLSLEPHESLALEGERPVG